MNWFNSCYAEEAKIIGHRENPAYGTLDIKAPPKSVISSRIHYMMVKLKFLFFTREAHPQILISPTLRWKSSRINFYTYLFQFAVSICKYLFQFISIWFSLQLDCIASFCFRLILVQLIFQTCIKSYNQEIRAQ